MRGIWRKLRLGPLLCVMCLTGHAQSESGMWDWTPLPSVGGVADTAYRKGVSAVYAGRLGERLVVAGGCNFPGVPAAEGGKKTYYNDVYALRLDAPDRGWERVGRLPEAAAYGVALPTDSGVAFIGGTTSHGPLVAVWELRGSEKDGEVTCDGLPPLPMAVDNMAGVRLGRRLYVVGGNVSGAPSNRMFSLSLDSLTAGWREEPPFPGEPRTQPVAVALRRGGESCLFLFGGFAGASASCPASVSLTAWCYVPSARRWEPVAAPTDGRGESLALGGGAGYALDDTTALCLGGVNKDVFLAALQREQRLAEARASGNDSLVRALQAAGHDYMTRPPAWYRFNRCVLRYTSTADRWDVVAEADQAARAGAALVGRGPTFYYFGGELKPGVRTPALWQGRLR